MKLMYALGPSLPDALHSRSWHGELAAAGVTRLAVGADDEHVAAAQLRLQNGEHPVRAVVSVWTEGSPAAVTELIVPLAPAVTGWSVTERIPLEPPSTPDGTRVDALVNVALLRIPADLTAQEWERRWLEDHTAVAIETQATFGYLQNRVVEPLPGTAAERGAVAALVEEYFPMAALTDWHAFYGSDGDKDELHRRMQRMAESTATFGASTNLDLVPTSHYNYRLA